ncbi:MAG: MgtC/SapB family protein [Ruminococcaceae bacterium]|nr:MgtC/SapB family protein [Oscillospiraceae bacterium]
MFEHEILTYLRDLNLVSISLRLVLALFLGGAIGFERGRRGRAAGFRTHIIVCLGATMATMTGQFIIEVLGLAGDPARLGAQVISGIGFLGVGTILVTGKSQVRGLTTAAGLWSTAAVGLSIGIGFYEAAILCTLLLCFTIIVLHHLDNLFFANKADIDVYIEIADVRHINKILKDITEKGYHVHNIEIKPSRTGKDNIGLDATIDSMKKKKRSDIVYEISTIEDVVVVFETM